MQIVSWGGNFHKVLKPIPGKNEKTDTFLSSTEIIIQQAKN